MAKSRPVQTRPRRHKKDFIELMREVPVEQFTRMVTKCCMPADDAKDLCVAFKELKA